MDLALLLLNLCSSLVISSFSVAEKKRIVTFLKTTDAGEQFLYLRIASNADFGISYRKDCHFFHFIFFSFALILILRLATAVEINFLM